MSDTSDDAIFQDNIFDNPLIFSEVNSETQKDICVDVDAPALTWHMAFLIGKDVRSTLEDELDTLALRLIYGLRDRTLLRSDDPIWPSSDDQFILFNSISRFDADGNLVGVHPDDHSKRMKRLLRAEERSIIIFWHWPSAVYGDKKVAIKVKVFQNVFTMTVTIDCSSWPHPLNKLAFDKLTFGFWTDYSRFLFQLDPELLKTFAGPVFAAVFADIRGVVTRRAQPTVDHARTDWAGSILTEPLRLTLTHDDDYECTASYMLDGKVLFATALGVQPLDYPDNRRIPMTFLMAVPAPTVPEEKNVDRKQLGRLLERLHLTEMLRHAALLDLSLLREASRKLAAIDTATQDARAFVERFGQTGAVNVTEVAPEPEATTKRNKVEAARAELNTVANEFLESKRNIAGAGLTFRIESSRYYVSQMKAQMPAFRMARVEGYRTYKQFIDRKLGATFEFIDRLGTRYERGTTVMARIEQSLNTTQTRKTGEELKALGSSIEDIQSYGELLLLCVLAPYYIIGSLHYIEELKDDYRQGLALTFILALSYYATGRFFRTDPEKGALVPVGLFAAWAVGMGLAYKVLTISPQFVEAAIVVMALCVIGRFFIGLFAAPKGAGTVTAISHVRLRALLIAGLIMIAGLLGTARWERMF